MKYNKILVVFFLFVVCFSKAQQTCPTDTVIPFTIDSTYLRIWNKTEYIPFFVKATNLGVAVPGKFPGELEVSRAQYGRWFGMIKEAGFNSIRLYTLHFPHFYEVLDSFNTANPKNPLYIFQGVWMEEEVPGYNNDLYFLNTFFNNEIDENVDCIHGNRTIAQRVGKAYGTYTADVSKWNIGYIIGRETHPVEVLTTMQNHANDTVFSGIHFSITGNAAETFVTAHLDHLVNYENINYQTQRPVSFSSWPTLDPIKHYEEPDRQEDTVSIDLGQLNFANAPAGYFASYHAYPYYPDFISNDSYNQAFSDYIGPNSYLGYITRLKNHYNRFPLIIAETSVPSSWGIAHYATSGMNHGGFDQQKQGETVVRLFNNVVEANCGGAMQFSWMDEWFKRTWVTDKIDYNPDRRILWHNLMGAEQNYGLIGFQKPLVMQDWATFNSNEPISGIKAAADYDFFHIGLKLSQEMQNPDNLWIALDTYDADLGESVLPTGDTIQNRAEFLLHITNYSAELFVTEAYDIFGIWHNSSLSSQLYHSTPTNGAPWIIERWRNNNGTSQVQYVGNLKVNQSFLPSSTMDAITIYSDSVHIRLPWSLIHFTDPSRMTVFNDLRNTTAPEDTTSDGVQLTVFYHNQRTEPTTRFTWPFWNTATDAVEYKKTSYFIVKAGLEELNNPALACSDSYNNMTTFPFFSDASTGVVKNDFDLDGNTLEALLTSGTLHGNIDLNTDGSFTYTPDEGYIGEDHFEYCIFDGKSLSSSATVCLQVNHPAGITQQLQNKKIELTVFPNPSRDVMTVRSGSDKNLTSVALFSPDGKLLFKKVCDSKEIILNVEELAAGIYYLQAEIEKKSVLRKVTISK